MISLTAPWLKPLYPSRRCMFSRWLPIEPSWENRFFLCFGDAPHLYQTPQSIRGYLPAFAFGKDLSQKAKVAERVHHLDTPFGKPCGDFVKIKPGCKMMETRGEH